LEIEQYPVGMINISWDGGVSTLSPELLATNLPPYGDFVLANVADDSLEDVVTNQVFRAAYRDIVAGFKKCRQECPYFTVCGGGQPSIKLYENGSFISTETPSCQMRIKAAMNVAVAFLEERAGLEPAASRLSIADRIDRIKQFERLNRPLVVPRVSSMDEDRV
jgi:uncharacterized protein